jgi:hypothetical protein
MVCPDTAPLPDVADEGTSEIVDREVGFGRSTVDHPAVSPGGSHDVDSGGFADAPQGRETALQTSGRPLHDCSSARCREGAEYSGGGDLIVEFFTGQHRRGQEQVVVGVHGARRGRFDVAEDGADHSH